MSGMIVILTAVYFLINYKTPDTQNVPTVANLTVDELLEQLSVENANDLKQYLDQAIVVSGYIKQVTTRDNITTVLLQDKAYKNFILCELQNNTHQQDLDLMPGQKIKVKGIYKGALMDVILLNSIILDPSVYEK